jgi:maltose alpha-D-glucosyltransferase/alpha-amylase
MEYHRDGSEPGTLAMLQPLVENQGDGWCWTLEELGRYYETCSTRHSPPDDLLADGASPLKLSQAEIPAAAREAIGLYMDSAATLGRTTAEMHLVLGSPTKDPAFQPQLITAADLTALANGMRNHAVAAFDTLRESLPTLPDEVVGNAGLVLSHRRSLLERFQHLEHLDVGASLIRIHGDYHLGQVLCVRNDYVILDFEGEPARPLAERRTKQTALKDVAGMLRSFSYAAYEGLMNHVARRPEDFAQLEPWATLWERWISAAFLKSYLARSAGASFLPANNRHLEKLLEVLVLDKALYELRYELNHRPSWLRIPLWGILRLAQQEAPA